MLLSWYKNANLARWKKKQQRKRIGSVRDKEIKRTRRERDGEPNASTAVAVVAATATTTICKHWNQPNVNAVYVNKKRFESMKMCWMPVCVLYFSLLFFLFLNFILLRAIFFVIFLFFFFSLRSFLFVSAFFSIRSLFIQFLFVHIKWFSVVHWWWWCFGILCLTLALSDFRLCLSTHPFTRHSLYATVCVCCI